ncbi:MAG: type II toxin-antitoxin system VapC family toxin [Planctomycetes bacterium]|nr:type II toxin-antitoxin system VapC family toxin [Planctomycetota bacterium]
MTPVFADTYYYLALVNPKDESHAKAIAFAKSATRPMVVTDWVITEVADGLCAAANRPVFARLLKIIQSPSTEIVHFDSSLMDRGLQLFAERQDKDWPLTDCISFVVMQDRGIMEALTADHHFVQAGFVALLK